MYIIRPPSIKGTPSALAHDLGWKTRFYPNPNHPRKYRLNRDFIMTNVNPLHVEGATDDYKTFSDFGAANKLHQRRRLYEAGVPIPGTAASHENAAKFVTGNGRKFVARPLRHSRGIGYRVTENPVDFQEGIEYISELFPKRREYRVIFVFGKPLIFLRKKPNEGVTPEEAWGHEHSFFQTINDIPASYIGQSEIIKTLAAASFIRGSHIVAADILFNKNHNPPFVCLELNLCPSLSIDNNREKVVKAIKERNCI